MYSNHALVVVVQNRVGVTHIKCTISFSTSFSIRDVEHVNTVTQDYYNL